MAKGRIQIGAGKVKRRGYSSRLLSDIERLVYERCLGFLQGVFLDGREDAGC